MVCDGGVIHFFYKQTKNNSSKQLVTLFIFILLVCFLLFSFLVPLQSMAIRRHFSLHGIIKWFPVELTHPKGWLPFLSLYF